MIQQVCESLLSATDRCCCYFVCICGKSLLPLPLFLSADVVNQTQQQTHHQHRSKEVLCVSVSVCVCVCVSITHSLPPLCPVCVCVREGAQGNRVKKRRRPTRHCCTFILHDVKFTETGGWYRICGTSSLTIKAPNNNHTVALVIAIVSK